VTPQKKRVWSDKTGTFSIEAEHVETIGDTAVLKRADGKVIRVKIDVFSEADQRVLRVGRKP
jgi:sporulation protein YlmC with PRC-barrel domain